jgi:hypothetical protein
VEVAEVHPVRDPRPARTGSRDFEPLAVELRHDQVPREPRGRGPFELAEPPGLERQEARRQTTGLRLGSPEHHLGLDVVVVENRRQACETLAVLRTSDRIEVHGSGRKVHSCPRRREALRE